MGTPETHKGFDLVRQKGSLEQARESVDTTLLVLVHAHRRAQRSQDSRLTDELIAVITALRHIKVTLGQATKEPLGDKETLDKGQPKMGS